MKINVLIKFGKKVREKRAELHLSQEELAERTGVHRTYIGISHILLIVNSRTSKNITAIPWEICLKPLILLAVLNCMAQKSGSSHPIAQRNVKNA